MKQHLHIKTILFYLFIASAVTSKAQQEYTLTTSPANITAAKALIDLPGLSGNTNAIIIATPLGNTKTLNPHPTGAWYYSGKWNIFNCDFAPMPVGMTYKVQYFLNPGANQFLHLVTQGNLGAEGSYIDNSALNNKPNAQFTIFPNHSPDVRAGSWLNPNEAKAAYNASNGKWYITNINGQLMQKGCAYNIVMNTGNTVPPPGSGDTTGNGNCTCPASLPPNGTAGGDLSGIYPNPTVQKINGFPVSITDPQIGQVLKWNGAEWTPGDDDKGGSGTASTSGIKVLEYYISNKLLMNVNTGNYELPGLDRTINIPVNSSVIVTMTAEGNNLGCLACTGASFLMNLYIDNLTSHNQVLSYTVETNNSSGFSKSAPLRTVTLAAGNHRFKATAHKYQGADLELIPSMLGMGTKMIIIIIPQ